jgi:hypothetical protein
MDAHIMNFAEICLQMMNFDPLFCEPEEGEDDDEGWGDES